MTLTLDSVLRGANIDPAETLVARHAFVREHQDSGSNLRAEIGRPDLWTLRVFDVMLWMWGKANA